jgi:hypothetical protein
MGASAVNNGLAERPQAKSLIQSAPFGVFSRYRSEVEKTLLQLAGAWAI